MTAANSARAPANNITSGKTVLVIAPSARWLLLKLPIMVMPQVMHRPGLSCRANQRRDANQTQSPNSNCRKRVHSTLPFGALTRNRHDQRLTSPP
jgi:hypothetical protein